MPASYPEQSEGSSDFRCLDPISFKSVAFQDTSLAISRQRLIKPQRAPSSQKGHEAGDQINEY